MAQPAKGQEPSMEEILASIRRIIADDDGAKSPPPRAVEPAAPQSSLATQPLRPAALPPTTQPSARLAVVPPVEEAFVEPEPLAPAFNPEPLPPFEPEGDILDLTEQMAAVPPLPAETGFHRIDGELDIVFEESLSPPTPSPPTSPPPAVEAAPRLPFDRGERALISPTTSAAVDSAFNTLAQTVLVQNGRTLEDLVREMLRPMLKTWLDDNLPGMVERLVRAEIERVSRGRP
jgi:uncharacterized protein